MICNQYVHVKQTDAPDIGMTAETEIARNSHHVHINTRIESSSRVQYEIRKRNSCRWNNIYTHARRPRRLNDCSRRGFDNMCYRRICEICCSKYTAWFFFSKNFQIIHGRLLFISLGPFYACLYICFCKRNKFVVRTRVSVYNIILTIDIINLINTNIVGVNTICNETRSQRVVRSARFSYPYPGS